MKKYLLPLFLSLAFFITGILTLPDFGVNWDGPYTFMRGQAYVQLFLTGKKTYDLPKTYSPVLIYPGEYISRFYINAIESGPENTKAKFLKTTTPYQEFKKIQRQVNQQVSFYQSEMWNGQYMISSEGPGHLPLPDILSALTNKIFYQTLGIMGDIESYQLFFILASSLGVFIVTLFTLEISGSKFASLLAGGSLALFPIYFAESHFSVKDPFQASLFAGSVWAFWHWVKDGKLRWFGVFGIFVGLAMAVKWDIVFIPFILIPWLFLIRKTQEFKAWFKLGRLGRLGGLGGLGVILFLILIWPYSWNDPVRKLWGVAMYYIQTGIGMDRIQPDGFVLPAGFNSYPLVLFLSQTPVLMLILMVVGIFGILRLRLAQDLKVGILLILWLVVPLIRVSVPYAWFYNGLRQIMEVLPAVAILAGLGGYYLSELFKNRIKVYIKVIILIFYFIFLSSQIIRLHPYQNIYFNSLVGGIDGAVKKNMIDWTITYGSIYKKTISWLNQNAPKDAKVAHLSGQTFALLPLWLREDISISADYFSGFDQKGEYFFLHHSANEFTSFASRYPVKFLTPAQRISAEGIPVLTIYQNSPKYSKKFKEETLKILNIAKFSGKGSDFIEIDLGKEVMVTRILVVGAKDECLEGDHQYIRFIRSRHLKDPINPRELYVKNEIKSLDNQRKQFLFAAEPAQYIHIYPTDDKSCFAKGEIVSISYLVD